MPTGEPLTPLPERRALTDGVVLLREPLQTDVEAITAAVSTPDVAHYTTVPAPCSRTDGEGFVAKVGPWWEVGNERSRRVAEAVGFQMEGVARRGRA